MNGTLINDGTITGGAGGDGGSGGNGGAGGDGGDGGHGLAGSSPPTYIYIPYGTASNPHSESVAEIQSTPANGGAGGMGGTGGNGGNGGVGGNGGAGVSLQDATLVNSGSITGGNGGNQGAGGTGGEGGSGGSGGAGADGGTTYYNCDPTLVSCPANTVITAEDGVDGAHGASGSGGAFGAGGNGGVGVLAQGGADIVNSGTIAGGKADGGTGPSAAAVLLQGNGNTLTLEAGSQISGAVVSQGNNTLSLGGDRNAAAGNTFTLSGLSVGGQYQGFSQFAKTGSSTWTVTGNGGAFAKSMTVAAGKLVFDATGTVADGTTVSGGELDLGSGSRLGGSVTVASGAAVRVTGANVTWNGTFADNGAYISDPSSQVFSNLDIGSSGYLQGGSADVFDVLNNFVNDSTQNSLWSTAQSTLEFSGLSGTTHEAVLAGLGGVGAVNNFSWGALTLSAGNSLDLTAGPGNALYVDYLNLQGGSSQLSDLFASTGVTLYYNANDPRNAYLLDSAYQLGGGGALDPYAGFSGGTGTVAEPGALALMLAGLALVGVAVRRRAARL